VRDRLERAVEALERAGATVDRKARPAFAFDYAVEVYDALLQAAECGGYSRSEIEAMAQLGQSPSPRDGAGVPRGPDGAGAPRDDIGARLARLASQRHREWLSWNERRLQMRRKWRDFFRTQDAVLLPVEPTAAIPHDPSLPAWARRIVVNGAERPYTDQFKWVGLVGVAYLPATVVPVGETPDGLPVGIQIAGPFLEDRTTLDLGRHLERLLGGFRPPPGY
jgi:amidase